MKKLYVTGLLICCMLAGCNKKESTETAHSESSSTAVPTTATESTATPAQVVATEQPAPAASAGATKSGEEVYNSVCQTCHSTGLLNSPKIGDKEAWVPRIAQGKPILYKHAIEGFNQMPAKGGNPNLSDKEVEGGVDYMVDNSQ